MQQTDLYSPTGNYKTHKLLLASKIHRAPVKQISVSYDYSNKTLTQNVPYFSIPALHLKKQNRVLCGSSTILAYLDNSHHSHAQKILIKEWIEKSQKLLQPSVGCLYLHQQALVKLTEQQLTKAKSSVIKILQELEQRLRINSFIVGDRLTIADIEIYSQLKAINSSVQKNISKPVKRWLDHIQSIEGQLE